MKLPLRIKVGPGDHYDVYGADGVLELSNEGYYPSAPGLSQDAHLIVYAVNTHKALVSFVKRLARRDVDPDRDSLALVDLSQEARLLLKELKALAKGTP